MKLQTKAQLKEIIKQSISEYFEEAGINDILIQLYTRIRKLSMTENKIKNQSKKKKDKQNYDNTAGIKNILKKNNENLSDGNNEVEKKDSYSFEKSEEPSNENSDDEDLKNIEEEEK